MTWSMKANGTITRWQATDGTDILFPEDNIVIRKEVKLRGGAPVCCPIFGPKPKTEAYEGVSLAQHGLVRACKMDANDKPVRGNPAVWQQRPTLGNDGWFHTGFHFTHPWPHEAWVAAKAGTPKYGVEQMHHRITLGTETIYDIDMPYSLGFHPYFATKGNAYGLKCGDEAWGVHDLAVGESMHVTKGSIMTLETIDRTITIALTEGYNGFYVWSDAPERYVCIEPVCLARPGADLWLYAGDAVSCACTLTYTPKT